MHYILVFKVKVQVGNDRIVAAHIFTFTITAHITISLLYSFTCHFFQFVFQFGVA